MPLQLSLYTREGVDDFYVDDTRVSLHEIHGPYDYKLKVHGASIDKVYTINQERAVEILPGVRIFAGDKKQGIHAGEVSAVIDAPRRIEIHRGKIYKDRKRREAQQQQAG